MQIAVSGTEFDASEGIGPLISAAQAARVAAVETWYPKNYVKDTIAGAHAALRDTGLEVVCISTPSTLYGAASAEGHELLRQALDLAAECGARRVNTYFGHSPVVDDARAVETYSEKIAPLIAEAAERGIVIVLENEFDVFGWDPHSSDITRRPAVLRRLMERVDSAAFRINFDAANFHCAGVDAFGDAYRLLHDYIGYLHVKDVRTLSGPEAEPVSGWLRFTDHDKAYSTVPLGTGEVPWETLLTRLIADGYDGCLTLEPHCARDQVNRQVSDAADVLRARLAGRGALNKEGPSVPVAVRFDHARLDVTDLAVSEQWYTAVLGLQRVVRYDTDGTVIVQLAPQGMPAGVELWQQRDLVPAPHPTHHVAFSVNDVPALVRRARGLGHAVVSEPRRIGEETVAMLSDPDGHLVEVNDFRGRGAAEAGTATRS